VVVYRKPSDSLKKISQKNKFHQTTKIHSFKKQTKTEVFLRKKSTFVLERLIKSAFFMYKIKKTRKNIFL